MIVAEITAGAVAGSTSVTVTAAVANGTVVLVYRGGLFIGQGVIGAGVCAVAVQPLAVGDIIQASVTQRGNQAGIPVVVTETPQQPTGWVKPDHIFVNYPDGTYSDYGTDDYIDSFGEQLGSSYSPLLAGVTLIPAEYTPNNQPEFGFDIIQTMTAGQTTLAVVARGAETILTGWNGAAVSTNAPLTVTSGGTVTVSVKRDDYPTTLTRTLSVTVLTAPSPTVPTGADILGLAYRLFDSPGGYLVQAHINSAKSCEATLSGFTSSYLPGIFYASLYQEVQFATLSPGTYTLTARVAGDTNAANYRTIVLTI